MKSANPETAQPDLSVVKVSSQTQAIDRPQPASPLTTVDMGALFEAAVKQGSAMEVIKELRQMEAEVHQRQAKADFARAMAEFQADCPIIIKNKSGASENIKYAPLEVMLEIVGPYEKKHRFTHRFDQDIEAEAGYVTALCIVTHEGGHSETSRVKVRYVMKQMGKFVLSDAQVDTGTMTSAKRKAFENAFGLVVAGEDKDFSSAQRPRGPSTMRPPTDDLKPLARELWNVLASVRGDKDGKPATTWTEANKWLWKNEVLDGAVPEEVPNLTAAKFKEVIAKAKKKLSQ